MLYLVRKFLLFSGFVLGNFSILLIALLFLMVYTSKNSNAAASAPLEEINYFQESYASYNTLPSSLPNLKAEVVAGDARPIIIDNFFQRYSSPMVGLGKDIVRAADTYKIPYGYLPAIGQCEGGAGKVIPLDSHNTWGWGIYGDTITRFASWQEAIMTVSKGLKENYFDLGLDTPEKIMAKYTPPSQGSWAFCVRKFMDELK
jgi:hypothetical protein